MEIAECKMEIDRQENGRFKCTSCTRLGEYEGMATSGNYERCLNKRAREVCSNTQSQCECCSDGISRNFHSPSSVFSIFGQTMQYKRSFFTCKSLQMLTFTVLFILLVRTDVCNGFNLDITNPVEFRMPSNQPDSYFGYTVAMFRTSTGQKWVLVGAPRANSTFLPNSHKPGALFRCPTVGVCEELLIDSNDEEENNPRDSARYGEFTRVFVNGRRDQWLGASLDVDENRGIVTCASRWFNKLFETSGYYFMNGMCYEVPLDFQPSNIIKIPALVDAEKQTTVVGANISKYNYGMGSLGSSVHYTKEGSNLLMGTPGLHTWVGGFIDMRRDGTNLITKYDEEVPSEISEMAGYSMSSGRYFGNGQTFYTIGAPRFNLRGKVLLYENDRDNYFFERPFLVLDGADQGLGELPMNVYFGAVLCSVDVNADGTDDLLVGAPMYATGSEAHEAGTVLVYLGMTNYMFEPTRKPLFGSGNAGARFGSAMAALGDINKDGYNDVVIGAPYEDALQGAIYVYNGCKTGLWHHYSQRLPASDVASGLMAFGAAFSKPRDMDDDGVNDIAVGAYLSGHAFLFAGRPVINVDLTLTPSVNMIDTSASMTFSVDVCLHFDYPSMTFINIDVKLSLDTFMADFSRVAFEQTGERTRTFQVKVFSGDRKCRTNVALVKTTADLVTPVRIQAEYSVANFASASGHTPSVNKFSGDSPDKNLLVATKVLEFKKNCPNNKCDTDLKLSAEAIYVQHDDGSFIIGVSDLELDITISKTGHPSYGSNLFVAFPKSLQYQGVKQVNGDTEVLCGFVELIDGAGSGGNDDTDSLEYLQRQLVPEMDAEKEHMLGCSFGNPMANDTGVRFKLAMKVPEWTTDTELNFRLNATTLSNELNPTDNTLKTDIRVKNKVTTTFKGVSHPSFVTIRDASSHYEVSHVYELRNQGPSPLPASVINVAYPQVQRNGAVQFKLNTTEWDCPPPCMIKCQFIDQEDNVAPSVFAANVGPSYSVKKTSSENIGEAKALTSLSNTNCNKQRCSHYECTITNIAPRQSAVVTLEYVATGDILDKLGGGQVSISSEAFVKFSQLERLISETTQHISTVQTDLVPVSPPRRPVAWWIILVSIVAGLLLIIIVALILWKCGFFRRKQREEMARMQHSGEVEKMLPGKGDTVGKSVKTPE
ncbi:integrin alpha-9-like [Mya arenaria]|uniref:integrin alpha-9-like n=1 Tax=Mya arenaria TaxID=6604 RepID=UPI0022E35774|nr:integrin alpha-9-like [Mya arenaria]